MIETGDIQVIIEDGTNANLCQQIAYIKAGKTEIEEAVQEGIGDFNTNATEKTNTFNSNASAKTLAFNQNADAKTLIYDNNASEKLTAYNENATNKIADFNTNATNKTTAFDLNATNKTTAFNTNASEKTLTFNDNAIAKTSGFNSNATSKTNDFNSNAGSKTDAFNDNYTAKKALIDAEVQTAKDWATKTDGTVDGVDYSAKYYANNSKIWAEGSDADVAALGGTHSAKGWAEQEANNYSVTAIDSTTPRTLKDRFADILNVKDFGAKGDGVTDDTAAIQAMITTKGYAVFTNGIYNVSATTFDAPLYFESGAALTVDSGKAIIITNTINAPKEYIFKGDGSYTLKNDSDSGTDARNVEAWWFGILPDVNIDQSAKIQKALNSVGNNRESVLHFDIGAFSIGSTISVPRACLITGEGIRRTIFRPLTDGWNAFETNNVGVRFSNVQFENPEVDTIRTYPFVVINHNNCQIYDVAFLCNAKSYIEVNAEYTRIDGVMYGISKSLGSDSSLIKILSSHNIVNNIFSSTSSASHYPESIVKITNADNSTVEYNVINGIQNYNPATAVFIDSVSGTIRRTTISDIVTGGTSDAVAIKLAASGSANITNVDIWDVHPYLTCAKGIYIVNSGTGTVQDFTIDGLNFDGTITDGIYLERGSTGLVRYITIGADINWQGVTNKITTVGSVSGIIKALRTDNILTDITGYDATATQTLKHVNGVLTWVTDGE